MSTQTQAEKPAAPTLYTYDKVTGEYKPDKTSTSQWSPREKKWLIPACATTTEPPAAEDKKARCWNATTETWEQKPDYRGEKWYDKATRELHEIKDIGVEPDTAAWTQTEPKDTESVWDEEKSAWVVPPEVTERRNLADAQRQANNIITAAMQRSAVQTMSFSAAEFATLAKAKLFDEWQAGQHYDKGTRLVCDGIVYEVVSEGGVDSQEHQPPSAEGMLAVYRPLSVDSETGESATGTIDDPIPWTYGMDCRKNKYYSYEGKTYLALMDMLPCVWTPGAEGTTTVWQEVTP